MRERLIRLHLVFDLIMSGILTMVHTFYSSLSQANLLLVNFMLHELSHIGSKLPSLHNSWPDLNMLKHFKQSKQLLTFALHILLLQ